MTDDSRERAIELIRPLVQTIEGCAIDGGYVSHLSEGEASVRIVQLLADAGLLSTPADTVGAPEKPAQRFGPCDRPDCPICTARNALQTAHNQSREGA